MTPILVWLRRDLRLADNPALAHAAAAGAVIPVYLHCPHEETPWQTGAASRWWLHYSLKGLQSACADRGLPLIIRQPDSSLAGLRDLIHETGASRVVWNRLYEPATVERDRAIKLALREDGVAAESHNGALLYEPWEIRKRDGGHYKAFTPFWRCLQEQQGPPAPLAIPEARGPEIVPDSVSLEALDLLPGIPWDAHFHDIWEPGEAGARKRLEAFVAERLSGYDNNRNLPAQSGTSGLSPHLHYGDISPRQIWERVTGGGNVPDDVDTRSFLSEIAWREFSHHLLYYSPDMPEEPMDRRFRDFPWAADTDDSLLHAWQAGQTGIPIVDAGMRELWTTGWMHNRLRMVVGSLLTKNLRLPWQQGEAWFWDTLVDADLASNSMGWQWIQGCGADAAPYFRIFNPVRQGERFDPDGTYVRQWVPELADLPAKHIHSPWQAPAGELNRAGIRLGTTYPHPIVDLAGSRKQALEAYQAIR